MSDDPHVRHAAPDPDAPIPGLPEAADRLHETVGALATSVTGLNQRIGAGERRIAILGTVVIVLVLLVVGFVVLTLYVRGNVECQNNRAKAFLASTAQGRAAAQKDRDAAQLLDDALVVFIDTIQDPTATTAQRQQALTDFRGTRVVSSEQRAAAAKQRQDNPLPTDLC